MRKITHLYLGGGFSCLICGKAGIDGYASNVTLKGHWTPAKRTLRCKFCGYDSPAKITRKHFARFINWRDSLGSTMATQNHGLYSSVLNLF